MPNIAKTIQGAIARSWLWLALLCTYAAWLLLFPYWTNEIFVPLDIPVDISRANTLEQGFVVRAAENYALALRLEHGAGIPAEDPLDWSWQIIEASTEVNPLHGFVVAREVKRPFIPRFEVRLYFKHSTNFFRQLAHAHTSIAGDIQHPCG